MYRPLFILLAVVSAIHGSVSQQVPMQDYDGPSSQLEELQKNISSLWSYIHELRGAVTHHLNHLRQHQIEMEDSIHRLEHHSQGDSHASHTAGHSHSGEDHAHSSSSQHSHSGEDHHHHSGEHHHNGEHHHSGEHHSHGGDDHSHSHSGEHQSHGHYHDSHSHTDGDHAHGDDHSHGHAHKDSHENADDLQQTAQVSEPLIEPVIVASTRPPANHHHHHQHRSFTSNSRGGSINLMGEDNFHGASRSRNRTVAMPKYSDYHLYEFAVCNVAPNRALSIEQQQNIVGQVSFWQKKTGGPLNIHVHLSGFSMGVHHAHHQQAQQQEEDNNDADMPPMVHKHGFHIHALADIAIGCQGAGPHYNPKGVTHGGPKSLVRHVGDLGNIECDDHGIANLAFSDGIASLKGPYSVVGKSIVVHAGPDDLGLGGDDESLKTGNAGARLACCVIQKVDKLPFRSYKAMKAAIQYQN